MNGLDVSLAITELSKHASCRTGLECSYSDHSLAYSFALCDASDPVLVGSSWQSMSFSSPAILAIIVAVALKLIALLIVFVVRIVMIAPQPPRGEHVAASHSRVGLENDAVCTSPSADSAPSQTSRSASRCGGGRGRPRSA